MTAEENKPGREGGQSIYGSLRGCVEGKPWDVRRKHIQVCAKRIWKGGRDSVAPKHILVNIHGAFSILSQLLPWHSFSCLHVPIPGFSVYRRLAVLGKVKLKITKIKVHVEMCGIHSSISHSAGVKLRQELDGVDLVYIHTLQIHTRACTGKEMWLLHVCLPENKQY